MAWRRTAALFPAPLLEFHEAEWPPVEGECLLRYGCLGWAHGYRGECRPPDGEACGDRCYAANPGSAGQLRAADARYRWRMARAAWLGEDHPGSADEFIAFIEES